MFEDLRASLDALKAKDRYRSLRLSEGIDFGSNDYLGFAWDEELRRQALERLRFLPLSASSSRLLPGNHDPHLEVERAFARFVGGERALYFNSGYDANLALLTTLATRHDTILYDERSHASIHEGAHASNARSARFAHNDIADLRNRLIRGATDRGAGRVFIVVESVYSMDGDLAPMRPIYEIARAFGAVLIIDEAHATGVVGERGEGLATQAGIRDERVITMHTCGKALGSAGAFVVASETVIEYLINKARPFIYSTALPPLAAVQTINSIAKLTEEGCRLVTALRDRSRHARRLLREGLTRWHVPDGETPIIPIIVGSEMDAIVASEFLRTNGLSIPAVRPPTVPEGSSRLRLNISLRHTEAEIASAISGVLEAESVGALVG